MVVMYFQHAIINMKRFPNVLFIRVRKEVEDELASIGTEYSIIQLKFNPTKGSMNRSWIEKNKEEMFKKYLRSNYIIKDGVAARAIVQFYNIFIANLITLKYLEKNNLDYIDYDNFPNDLKDNIISETIFFSREFYENFRDNFKGYDIV